jgi:hypothetical protein
VRNYYSFKEIKILEQQEKKAAEMLLLKQHPQIGLLCRKGKDVFYTHNGGNYLENNRLDQLLLTIDSVSH